MAAPQWKHLHATALLVAFLSMILSAFSLQPRNSFSQSATGALDDDSGFLPADAPEDTPEDINPSDVSWLQENGGEDENPYMMPMDAVPPPPEDEHIYQEVQEGPYALVGRPRRLNPLGARRPLPPLPPGRKAYSPTPERRGRPSLKARPQSWAGAGAGAEGGGPGGPRGAEGGAGEKEEHIYEEVGEGRRASAGPKPETLYWEIGKPPLGAPEKKEGPPEEEEKPLHPGQYIGPMWSTGPPMRPLPPTPDELKAAQAAAGGEGAEGAAGGPGAPFVRGGPGRAAVREKMPAAPFTRRALARIARKGKGKKEGGEESESESSSPSPSPSGSPFSRLGKGRKALKKKKGGGQ